MSDKTKEKNEIDTLILIAIVLCFPVGLFLMWKNSSYKTGSKVIITSIFILGIILILKSCGNPKINTVPSAQLDSNTKGNASSSAILKTSESNNQSYSGNIIIESQIVKKVSGKHRYFFNILNKSEDDFSGKVKITLMSAESKILGSDTFSTNQPILSNLGDSVYMDIYTGPVSIHGVNGISRFYYEIIVAGETVKTGNGNISPNYEDSDAYDL